MLSEHIFFIIQRIPDILSFDNERNQILTFCQDVSNDERETFLELYSDYKKRQILESNSDDEIRRISEWYTDDKTMKKMLKWYWFDPMEEIQKLYLEDEILQFPAMRSCYRSKSSESDDNEREKFFRNDKILETEELYFNYRIERDNKLIKVPFYLRDYLDLYLPRYDKREEFKKKYRELSDDDKLEFLHNYNGSWRSKILKYLDFRQRWFHNHNPQTLFQIITLLMEGKQVVLSNDVKEGIVKLHKELSRIYDYLKDRQVLSEYEQQLYLNLSYIVDSSDDILDRVMSNHATALDIHTLLQTIRNFYNNILPSIQFIIYVNAKGNINNGDTQNIANCSFTINHSNPSNNNNYSRPKTYGHVPNPDLVGFNHEIHLLLNHLIQSHHETHVVGIVGPGGSGKTTLAKHIYHHPQINSHFASKVWVCISQSWDKTNILNSIWRQTKQKPEAPEMGYEQLVECLSELLCSKSYLVIVDDIWSMDAWYDIRSALPSHSGSKVVVTTRNKFLPQRIDPGVLIVEPKQLNDTECYELFKRALLDENAHHELLPMGKEMVKKCKGLPLAVVALAGVLGNDKSLSNWERISKTVTDKMLNMENHSTQGMVKDILAFSYYELPENLKPCTLYLWVFPEDYVIEAQQLIQLWIAECFMDEEDEAQEYLDQLAQRSIVEVVETNHKGQVVKFQIHDLIREMFINIYQDRDVLKNQVLRLAPSATLFDDGQKIFDSPMKILDRDLYGNSHARSLLFLNFQFDQCVELLQQLSIKLKRLRVLIIDHVPKLGLPGEIGNLIHLRYLQLSGRTKHLPGSIGNLENLLTLHLGDFYVDEDRKTINLEKLKELRHLYMASRGIFYKQIQVKGVEKLKKLKTWCDVEVGKCMLSVMPNLSHVLQDLCIRCIRKEEELKVVFRTPSITSNNLRTLVLQWTRCAVGDMSMMSKWESLTRLKLHGKIKKGTSLIFPPNLIHLEMTETEVEEEQVMNIISNSCPLLKILILEYEALFKNYWWEYKIELVCNENSFPKLEKLRLYIPHGLKSWIIGRGAMPRLNHLDIFVPWRLQSHLIGRLEVNDEARELISKLAPSFIPYLTLPRQSSKRKTMDLLPDLLS